MSKRQDFKLNVTTEDLSPGCARMCEWGCYFLLAIGICLSIAGASALVWMLWKWALR